jgi:hypothetical protein
MADLKDTNQSKTERQTIRDVVSEQIERDRQERIHKARQKQVEARTERSQKRLKAREDRGRQASQKRQAALTAAQGKVQSAVSDAASSLQRALRAAQETPIHRHSPEGREQLRLVRSLSAALGALRGVGRGTYYEVSADFANDVEA